MSWPRNPVVSVDMTLAQALMLSTLLANHADDIRSAADRSVVYQALGDAIREHDGVWEDIVAVWDQYPYPMLIPPIPATE
jgi:hypothetical protein